MKCVLRDLCVVRMHRRSPLKLLGSQDCKAGSCGELIENGEWTRTMEAGLADGRLLPNAKQKQANAIEIGFAGGRGEATS